MTAPAPPLLSVRNLSVRFLTARGKTTVVDDVSFDVPARSTVALVGESGSGKTVTSQAILRLVPPPGEIFSGEVLFDGKNLLQATERELLGIRGARISMVFQEPMTSLNPVYRVGTQIAEVIRIHDRATRKIARQRAKDLLALVGIASPEARLEAYPHELSGGMRQRVMIAMALACNPSLLIADEPTTALDVSVQAQILELFQRLQQELGMSILFITHDLGIVAEFASTAVVLYAGRVVETGPVPSLFRAPSHPYTRALLESSPPEDGTRPKRLDAIEGMVPDLSALPPGCRFAPRCPLRKSEPSGYERCDEVEPNLEPRETGRTSRCHFGEVAP